jgi:hypothetical protein
MSATSLSNVSHKPLVSTLEFLVLPQRSDVTALRIPATLGDSSKWKVFYICGASGFKSSLHKYYSGNHLNMTVEFKFNSTYFEIMKPKSQQVFSVKNSEAVSCDIHQIVSLYINDQFKQKLVCMRKDSDLVWVLDALDFKAGEIHVNYTI